MLLMVMTIFALTKMKNPITLSITLLISSLVVTHTIFKETGSSWMAFVVIITFSSGMMTLFLYTTSLTSNEKMKMNKTKMILMMFIMLLMSPHMNFTNSNNSMKTFSTQSIMIMMMIILMLTMITVSIHGHNPSQTLNTSF